MRKSFALIISLGALVLSSCSTPLVVLHVNDTHSHLEPIRDDRNYGHGGIIERGAIVDSVREARGAENVLLLHAGDFNQGTSYYTQFGGKLELESVNAFGYDCITLGNHEFDNGVQDLADRLVQIKCPVVCANLKLEGTPLEGIVKPYVIINRAGRKIGIIGLTSDLASNVAYEISSSLVQYDSEEVTNRYAEYLKKREKCDLVILLSHLGFKEDIKMAGLTKDIDLIIGGHSHTFLDDIHYEPNALGREIPIITDGCWGYSVGELIIR